MPDAIIVAGSHTRERQAILRRLYSQQQRKAPIAAALHREPHNTHDPNAIAVLVGADIGDPNGPRYGPEHIGYIPRQLAGVLAPQMDAGAEVTVTRVRINRDWSGERNYPMHVVKLTLAVREPAPVPVLSDDERGGF